MLFVRLTVLALAVFGVCTALAQDAPAAAPASPPTSTPEPAPADSELPPIEGANVAIDMMNSLEEFLSQQQSTDETKGEGLVINAHKAVELALSQNAKVLVAEDDLEAARAKVGQARSRVLPQVSV